MADSVVLEESGSINNAENLFMCCKNKPNFTYYVCIKCSRILHKSCLQRMKNVHFINSYKIMCKECYSTLESAVDDSHEMCEKKLYKLEKDNDEKDKQISKLQLDSKTILDESIDMESELKAMIEEREQEIRNLNKKVQTLESLIAKSIDDKNNVSDVCTQTSLENNITETEAIIQEGTQTDIITFSTEWTQTKSKTENEINMKKKNKRKFTLKRKKNRVKLRKKRKKSGENDLDNGFKVLVMYKNYSLNIQTKKDITPLVTTKDVSNIKCNENPTENNEGEVNFEEDNTKKAADDEKNGSMDASISEFVYVAIDYIEENSTITILIKGIKAVTPSCVNTPCGANSFSPTATPHNSPDATSSSSRCGSPEPYEEFSLHQLLTSSFPQFLKETIGGGAKKKTPLKYKKPEIEKQESLVGRIEKLGISNLMNNPSALYTRTAMTSPMTQLTCLLLSHSCDNISHIDKNVAHSPSAISVGTKPKTSLGIPGKPGSGELNSRLGQLNARKQRRQQQGSGKTRPDLGTVSIKKTPDCPEPSSTFGTLSSLLFGRKGGLF